jgi:hypothetical protein
MMKKLDNLKWSPKWVSHLGCVKGCLDFLGIEMTDAWLYGGTGHAFIINISEDSCPSGPTAWKTMMLYEQAPGLGYEIRGVFGSKYNQSLAGLQKQAWEFTCKSIDQGFPVYAWEIDIPEFYVIYGYDDVGYYYSGPDADNGKGPKPWKELGDTGIGLVELYNLKPVEARTPVEVVKSAFEKVIKHAGNPDDWILENYASGLKGFDTWIKGLKSGKANCFGMGYNAAVWHECRKFAVEFLQEARERLDGNTDGLFDQAIEHYQVVVERLGKVSERYPWTPEGGPKTIPVDDQCQEAVDWLKEVREAEAEGLIVLEKLTAIL